MKRIALMIGIGGVTVASLITSAAQAGIKYHAAIKYGIRY